MKHKVDCRKCLYKKYQDRKLYCKRLKKYIRKAIRYCKYYVEW